MRTRAAPATQGSLDSLCGIYALVNAVHDWEELDPEDQTERSREAFRYLLAAAEQLNLLTAHKIYDGFEWFELIEVFNQFASKLRYPFVAVPLSAAQEAMNTLSFKDLARRIIGQGGKLVVLVDSRRHWVLVHKFEEGGLQVDDSEAGSTRHTLHWPSSKTQGVVIVPRNSALARLS